MWLLEIPKIQYSNLIQNKIFFLVDEIHILDQISSKLKGVR